MKEVQNPEEIPQFRSEAEEAEFWAAHSLGDWFFEDAGPVSENILPPARPQASLLSELLDDAILARLKELAYRRGAEPLILVTEFVADRLDQEELRERMPSVSQEGGYGAPGEPAVGTKVVDKRDWQQKAFDYVDENTPLIEDEDLDFIVSSRVISDAASLLLEISNQISAATKRKAPAARLKRMMKGYNKLKEFCDRAFAIHEEKFGLPELTDEEPEQPEEEPEERSGDDESSEVTGKPADTGGTVTNIKEAMRNRERAVDQAM